MFTKAKTLATVLAAAEQTITDLHEVSDQADRKVEKVEQQIEALQNTAAEHRTVVMEASIIAHRMRSFLEISDKDKQEYLSNSH